MQKKKFSNTHEYYTYLREANPKDMSEREKKDADAVFDLLLKMLKRVNNEKVDKKLTFDNRQRLSTMMHPILKQKALEYGYREGYSLADIIEIALINYFNEKNITW